MTRHPSGLRTLFFAEMWERLSYYSARAFLILYMVAPRSDGGLELPAATAGVVMAVYLASQYLLAFAGGWIADRFVGPRRAALFGGLVILAGNVMLAVPLDLFFLGLAFVTIGTGLLKPSLSSLVGQLYASDDSRRDRGYTLYYLGINLGAALAPLSGWFLATSKGFREWLVTRDLEPGLAWKIGFAVGALAMLASLVHLLAGYRRLPATAAHRVVAGAVTGTRDARLMFAICAGVALVLVAIVLQRSGIATIPSDVVGIGVGLCLVVAAIDIFVYLFLTARTRSERKRVLLMLPLFVGGVAFFALVDQASTTLTLLADRHVEGEVFGISVEAPAYQIVNPLVLFLATPVVVVLWGLLARRGREPSSILKFAIGLVLAALSFVVLLPGLVDVRSGDTVAPAYLIALYVLSALAELCVTPSGLSSTQLLSAPRWRSMSVTLWFLGAALGNYLAGMAVRSAELHGYRDVFAIMIVGSAIVAAALIVVAPFIRRMSVGERPGYKASKAEPERLQVVEAIDQDESNPYVGPRPLGPKDLVHGRDWEVTELLQLVITRRVVLLHSPSGAGKTSLIQAGSDPALEGELAHRGLIARLAADGIACLGPIRVGHPVPVKVRGAPGINRYTISVIESLESVVHGDEPDAHPARIPDAELAELRLQSYLERFQTSARPQVLIFDQFEEFLTADPLDLEAKIAFLKQLDAVLADPRRRALFAMRTDYVGALDGYLHIAPERMQHRFCLDLMTPEAALEAIVEPARRAGHPIPADVASQIVHDLRKVVIERAGETGAVTTEGPFVEPVHLQLVCRRLWKTLRTTSSSTAPLSGVSIDEALGDYYEEAIERVSRETRADERDIRDWLEKKLIRHGFRNQIARAPDLATEGLANATIDKLIARYLVRREPRRGVTWFELSHDRFIEPIRQRNRSARAKRSAKIRAFVAFDVLVLVAFVASYIGARAQEREEASERRARIERVEQARTKQLASRNLSAMTLLAASEQDTVTTRMLFAQASRHLWMDKVLHDGAPTSLAFRADGALVTAGSDNVLYVVGLGARRTLALPVQPTRASVLSPDGTRIVVVHAGGATLFDILQSADALVKRGDLSTKAKVIAFSADSSRLAIYDGTHLRVFDRDGELVRVPVPAEIKENGITELVFSPDGRQLAAIANGAALRIWPGRREIGRSLPVESLAFSTYGGVFGIAYADGTIDVMAPFEEEEVHTFKVPGVAAIAFHPIDHHRIATMTHDGVARIWDATSGRPKSAEMVLEPRQDAAAQTPIAGAGQCAPVDAAVVDELWAITNQLRAAGIPYAVCGGIYNVGRAALRVDETTRTSKDIDIMIARAHVDRALVAVAQLDYTSPASADPSHEQSVRRTSKSVGREEYVLDLVLQNEDASKEKPAALEQLPQATRDRKSTILAYSPDGLVLLTAGPAPLAALWEPEHATRLASFEESDTIVVAALSIDGTTAAIATTSGSVKTWGALLGLARPVVDTRHAPVSAVAIGDRAVAIAHEPVPPGSWSPTRGDKTAPKAERAEATVSARPGSVWVWMRDGSEAPAWDGDGSPAGASRCDGGRVVGLQFDVVDAGLVVVCEQRPWLLPWGAPAEPIGELRLPDDAITAVTFTTAGIFAVAGRKEITLWRASGSTGAPAAPIDEPSVRWQAIRTPVSSPVTSLDLSRDGRRLVSSHDDGVVRVWSLDTSIAPSLTIGTSMSDAVFDATERHVLAVGDARTLAWSAESGLPVLPRRPIARIQDIALVRGTPDGTIIAATRDGALRLMSADLTTFASGPTHRDLITSIAIDHDRVATGSRNGVVHVWDLTGGSLVSPVVHAGPVTAIAFSPDRQRLVTASRDGSSVQDVALDTRSLHAWRELAKRCSPFQISRTSSDGIEKRSSASERCSERPPGPLPRPDRQRRAAALWMSALMHLGHPLYAGELYARARDAVQDKADDLYFKEFGLLITIPTAIDPLEPTEQVLKIVAELEGVLRTDVAFGVYLRISITPQTSRSVLITGALLALAEAHYAEASRIAQSVIDTASEPQERVLAFAILWAVATLTGEITDEHACAVLRGQRANQKDGYAALSDKDAVDRDLAAIRAALTLPPHPAPDGRRVGRLFELLKTQKTATIAKQIEGVLGERRVDGRPLQCGQ